MKYRIHRNLDKPFELLGIKGSYIGLAAVAAVVIICVAAIAGALTTGVVGIVLAAVLMIAGYLVLTELQVKAGQKGFKRWVGSINLPQFIVVKGKVWKR